MAGKYVLNQLLRDETGASAVEYGLILAMIVLAMMAALNSVATSTIDMWNDVTAKTSAAVNGN
ncbi:MAG TPA: Flp family type IVb pilin [Novosphingobium sp.]|nr:Flp family type IVb pilin [Novosphingobium sp.]